MNFDLILPNLKLARKITEKFFSEENPSLDENAFYMFSVSKFILLKERIIKKDSIKNILHFDNKKYNNYIPIIMDFYKQIKKSGIYKRNDTVINIKDNSTNYSDLEEAIWCFNKVRDSLTHGQYSFNFDRKSIVINNVADDNSYFLLCEIPINLLNSFSFIVEENTINDKDLNEKYKKYIKKMSYNFDIDKHISYNPYIYNYNNKVIKKESISNDYLNDNKIINNDIYNYSNIDKDIIFKKRFDKKDSNSLSKPIEIDSLLPSKEIEFILNKEVDKMSIEEVCRLAKLLLLIKPETKDEKQKITSLLIQFKMLLSKYTEEKRNEEFNKKTEELIEEMRKILGVKKSCSNANGIISLYNYMSLVFSQTKEIDYSKLKLHTMFTDFSPTQTNYYIVKESIKRKCKAFNSKIEANILNYNNYQSKSNKIQLMDIFISFYTDIMDSLGTKNKFVIDSVRNAVEHGNYNYSDKGYVIMYDLPNHNDIKTIKFVSTVYPNDLFDITKQIESNSSNEFLLGDFVQQLSPILGNNLFEKTWNNLNLVSNIIFGKELNLNYTMENMYHEAICNYLTQNIVNKN